MSGCDRGAALRAELAAAQMMPRGARRWIATAFVVGAILEDCGPIRLAVSGSRHVRDVGEVADMLAHVYLPCRALETAPQIVQVLQGGDPGGVDALVDEALVVIRDRIAAHLTAADRLPPALVSECIPANWSKHGRSAGPIRNRELLDSADAWAGLWDGRIERCGTYDTAQAAAERGWIGWAYPRPDRKLGGWLYAVSPDLIERGLG